MSEQKSTVHPKNNSRLNFSILQIQDYRTLLLSRWFMTLSLQVQAVIVGWQVYQLKQDPLLLGLIGLTEALPAIGSSFFSGHIVDNSKPVKILRISFFILLLNSIFIFSSVLPHLNLNENSKLFILFFGIFISGAARSFIAPSAFSLIPEVVPRALISTAAAFNSSSHQLALVLGPAIGGLVYSFFGPFVAFLLPCFLALFSFLISNFFHQKTIRNKDSSNKSEHEDKHELEHEHEHPHPHPHDPQHQHENLKKREPFFESLTSGFKFTWNHKVLLSTMTLDMFSVLFGGAVSILPIFADKVFGVGSTGLGLLRAAPAIGAVFAGVFLALKPFKVISGAQLLLVVLGFGFSMIFFALAPSFYFALFFLALSGVFDGISMVIRGTLLQLLTPQNMRGRVSALNSIFITSSNEIGAFESGLAASFMGLIPSVVFGGIMTIAVVIIIHWKTPQLSQTKINS